MMDRKTLASCFSDTASLKTKNTFLDCQSPWIDYVKVDERPKSDPTSDFSSCSVSEHSQSSAGPGGFEMLRLSKRDRNVTESSSRSDQSSSTGNRLVRRSQGPQPPSEGGGPDSSEGDSQARRPQRRSGAACSGSP
ncbi:unnamed protein product [Prorocentrum cordatum]|uniref:Uncharacterized protein n=1 Tax=Prorocentrum cordatum TaxID=2364126 RepID=A0ABN9RX38_9DINO|nr:unnamed protein product [Polarella glacialis]